MAELARLPRVVWCGRLCSNISDIVLGSSMVRVEDIPWIVIEERNNRLIPNLTTSIERANSTNMKPDIITTKDPYRRLILVANRKACIQPVIDVR